MNALEAHFQSHANVKSIYRLHRSNEGKTMRHLDMVENKQDVAKQVTIDEAIENIRIGNYVKGTIVDYMA